MKRVASKLHCIPNLNSRFTTFRFISQLFVSRLSFFTTNDQLRQLFSPFGTVKQARLVMDRQTGRTKGFGFVTFESETDAENALKALNGRIVEGRLIFVEHAKKTTD